MAAIKSFASSDRFLAEIRTPQLRPGYVLAGDETFLYQRCRQGILDTLAPPDQRDFCLHDLDLADTTIFRRPRPRPDPIAYGSLPGHLRP